MGRDADDLWSIMRYALPEDKDAGAEYRENVDKYLKVLRVYKKDSPWGGKRHPVQTFETRTGNNEKGLAKDLQLLAYTVAERLEIDNPQSIFMPLNNYPLSGDIAIGRGMQCMGSTHDTDYSKSERVFLRTRRVVALVGVDHTKTENAMYVSLSLYDESILKGFYAIPQVSENAGFCEGVLRGSAREFLERTEGGVPSDLGNPDCFFVHLIARPYSALKLPGRLGKSSLCTVFSEDEEEELYFPKKSSMIIVRRAYLLPSGVCGAKAELLLSPIMLNRDYP